MVWATISSFLVLGLVMSGSVQLDTLQRSTSLEFAVNGQAREVAESGLVCALAWMRAQPTQPVTAFAPRRDLAADPPIDETDDPSVGLVRTFEIAPGYWGRFIVRPGKAAEPYVDANKNGMYDRGEKVQDLDGNRRRTAAWGTRDITSLRGGAASGLVWHLESEGYIFRRPRADLALGQTPNVQVARVVLATDVRRLAVTLPASAALVTSRADETEVKKGALVTSPVHGVAYRASTGSPKISSSVSILAPIKHGASPGLLPTGGVMDGSVRRISIEEIFGVGMSTLRAMADQSTGTVRLKKNWKKQRLGQTIPDNSLVIFKSNPVKGREVIFDKKFPLRGTGIVVIDGDVEFKKGSASDFRGILVVLGELRVNGPAKFRGTVYATKKTKIQGKKSNTLLHHDPALVTRMLNELSRYRRFKTTYVPAPTTPDDRPEEAFLTETRPGDKPLEFAWELTPGEILPK